MFSSPLELSVILLFSIELIGVTLINNIIQASGVQFYHTSSAYCTVCSPPQVKSPSIAVHPHFTLLNRPHPLSL